MPVVDLAFDLDGVRYIKPAPRFPSEFWPAGIRPRYNTSNLKNCPEVARTFPFFSELEWKQFKEAMPSVQRLGKSYSEWLKSGPDETTASVQPLKPTVLVKIKFEDFKRFMTKPENGWQFLDILDFSAAEFHRQVLSLFEQAKDKDKTKVIPLNYIHLILSEVGNDQANDFASICYVSEVPGFERTEPLVENARLFFEYGMAVAAAYAIKHKVEAVLYTKKRIG